MQVTITTKLEDIRIRAHGIARTKQADMSNVFKKAKDEFNSYISVTFSTPKKPGTDAQNRTFHALLNCYWTSGEAQARYESWESMRDSYKLKAGGAKEYKGVLEDSRIVTVKELEDLEEFDCLAYVPIPKSWTELSLKGRAQAIDLIISDMMTDQVASKKFDEILEGIENGRY